jgi:hypothetical protein
LLPQHNHGREKEILENVTTRKIFSIVFSLKWSLSDRRKKKAEKNLEVDFGFLCLIAVTSSFGYLASISSDSGEEAVSINSIRT